MDFNAFNTPAPIKNNVKNNIGFVSESLDFGGFSSGTNQVTTQQPKF